MLVRQGLETDDTLASHADVLRGSSRLGQELVTKPSERLRGRLTTPYPADPGALPTKLTKPR